MLGARRIATGAAARDCFSSARATPASRRAALLGSLALVPKSPPSAVGRRSNVLRRGIGHACAVADAGHSSHEPGITSQLVAATDRIAKTGSPVRGAS